MAAVRETGVSMMYTSIVLFFGFLMFAMSEFDGTRSLGLLVSVTLLVAMFTNLMLLPSLLMSFAQFVTTRTFSEPFIDLLDEEEDVALDQSSPRARALAGEMNSTKICKAGIELPRVCIFRP